MLTLEAQQMEEVRIHPIVGIAHRLPPQLIARGRQLGGCALGPVRAGEVILQIAERMDHATRIFLVETAKVPIGAARIVREYSLEIRWMLPGRMELLGGVSADPDHADIAVTPGLPRDPLDQIVAIPEPRATVAGFPHAARRTDHVDVAARHEKARVAGLHMADPEGRPCWLRRKRSRILGSLNLLAVRGKGKEYGEFARRLGAVHVDNDANSIAHRHGNVALDRDRRVFRHAVIAGRKLVAGKQIVGADATHAGLSCATTPAITATKTAGSAPVTIHA